MTRQKKSRKPGVGSSGAVKADKSLIKEEPARRIRKKTGNKAGTRQVVATNKTDTKTSAKSQDPRIGSKKPISLGEPSNAKAVAAPSTAKKPQSKTETFAQVRPVSEAPVVDDLMAELDTIENDPLLLIILEKQEEEQDLSEHEVAHFNQLMERHQEISEQLGLEDDDDEQPTEEQANAKLSEDQLWHKFNDGDFEKDL